MRRTPLKRTAWSWSRKVPMLRGTRLARVPMQRRQSDGAKRQAVLRKSAYQMVDLRSGGQCEAGHSRTGDRCPAPATQHQHRRPRRGGGSTDPATETAANIIGTCPAHHDDAESHRSLAYLTGWLIRAGHDPLTSSVLLWCGRVWLTEDGRYIDTPPTTEKS